MVTRYPKSIRGCGIVPSHRRWATITFTVLSVLLAGCDEEFGPAPPAVYVAGDYLWQEHNEDLLYRRSDGFAEFTHSLHFENGAITDTRTDASGSEVSSCILAYERSEHGGQLVGCSPLSLLHVPEHIRFENYVYSTPGPEMRAGQWVNIDSRTMLAIDLDGRLHHYDMATHSWEVQAVPWTSPATALTRDNSGDFPRTLCGTAADGLYMHSDAAPVWTRMPAPEGYISGLAASASGTIHAIIEGYLYQYSPSTASWDPFPVSSLDDNVTCVAILDLDATRAMLLFGRTQSVLVHVLLESSMPVQITFPRPQVGERTVAVRCSPTSAYPSVAIAHPPMLHISTQRTGAWASVPVPVTGQLTAVCQSDNGGTVLIGTDDGVYRFDGSPARRSGLDGNAVRSLHCGPDGAFYCGTTEGTYRAEADGTQWTRIDRVPILRRSPTGLMLLPASFGVGSSWEAGRLIVGTESGRKLIGRVTDHYNEFRLPEGRGSYVDIVVVRYAQELPDGDTRADAYAWNVYYARNFGPIYLEETMDGVLQARAVLVTP